jgi:hypothetical protein
MEIDWGNGWGASELHASLDRVTHYGARRSDMFTSRPRMTLSDPVDVRAGCFVLRVAYVELNRRSSDGGAAAAAT